MWTPLVSRELPIYDSDYDVYNILFDIDNLNLSNENGTLKSGSKSVNGTDADRLKKKRRRRWNKAYNNRRKRRPAKANNTVVSSKSQPSSEDDDEEDEELTQNISQDECEEDTEEENDRFDQLLSDTSMTLNGTIEQECQSPFIESNCCDNFSDDGKVNGVRKKLKFDSEMNKEEKHLSPKLKRRSSVNNDRGVNIKKLKTSPSKYSVVVNGNGKVNGNHSEDDGVESDSSAANSLNGDSKVVNGNCTEDHHSNQGHNHQTAVANGDIDH